MNPEDRKLLEDADRLLVALMPMANGYSCRRDIAEWLERARQRLAETEGK